jgi:hypothetical protein
MGARPADGPPDAWQGRQRADRGLRRPLPPKGSRLSGTSRRFFLLGVQQRRPGMSEVFRPNVSAGAGNRGLHARGADLATKVTPAGMHGPPHAAAAAAASTMAHLT